MEKKKVKEVVANLYTFHKEPIFKIGELENDICRIKKQSATHIEVVTGSDYIKLIGYTVRDETDQEAKERIGKEEKIKRLKDKNNLDELSMLIAICGKEAALNIINETENKI